MNISVVNNPPIIPHRQPKLSKKKLGFFYTTQQAAGRGQPAMARGAHWLDVAI
jgi:hypothetical protein